MPVLSAVVILSSDQIEATLRTLRADPNLLVGEPRGVRLPLVLDVPDPSQVEPAWDALRAIPGVCHADLLYADLSDLDEVSP
jgi:hypothetical protein